MLSDKAREVALKVYKLPPTGLVKAQLVDNLLKIAEFKEEKDRGEFVDLCWDGEVEVEVRDE